MATETSQNEETCGQGKNGEEESVLLFVEQEQVKISQTLRKQSEEELFIEMLTPT